MGGGAGIRRGHQPARDVSGEGNRALRGAIERLDLPYKRRRKSHTRIFRGLGEADIAGVMVRYREELAFEGPGEGCGENGAIYQDEPRDLRGHSSLGHRSSRKVR